MRATTTCILKSAANILATLQYLSPRKRLQHDAQSVYEAISDVPTVVDWLRRSACRVGVTTTLSMVLAHYPEGLDVVEVTSGYPSETDVIEADDVLKLME